MNKLLCSSLCLLLASGPVNAAAVTASSTWTETYAVSSAPAHLEVSNVWGNVRVNVGEPGQITVSVSERRSAPDQALFDLSLEVLALDVAADASTVSLVVGDREKRWRSDRQCRDCRVEYQFDITVPADTTLDVATVTDGKVEVNGVGGQVSASNVNGPIEIAGISSCGDIDSVNGAIRIGFDRAPQQDCHVETINGDIVLQVPDHAGLVLAMDLMNGEMHSELPVDPLTLPVTVEKSVKDGRHSYRVQQMAGARVGAGGPTYTVTSMNGDLQIRKNSQ